MPKIFNSLCLDDVYEMIDGSDKSKQGGELILYFIVYSIHVDKKEMNRLGK